jgi:hypothetical protein
MLMVVPRLDESPAVWQRPTFGAPNTTAIGSAIIENPCGVPFITPHGLVFINVRVVASGESNRAVTRHIPMGTNALLPDSAESESLEKLFANICGQLRLRGRDVCNRLVYSFVYGGCQKCVGLALMRPAEHRCHA